MKRNLLLFSIIILLMLHVTPVLSVEADSPVLPSAPQPLKKTEIQLESYYATLELYEDTTQVKLTYNLNNPTDRKTGLAMKLPVDLVLQENQPALRIYQNGKELETTLDNKKRYYQWEIVFEPEEELILTLDYTFANYINEDGFAATGFQFSSQELWPDESVETALTMHFKGLNPGQILDIEPRSYLLKGSSLVWRWDDTPAVNRVLITSDINSEKLSWEKSFTPEEKNWLQQTLKHRYYLSAAFYFTDRYEKATREDKLSLRVGQAYYLEKAGKYEEAMAIWQELYADEVTSPHIYWALGKRYVNQHARIAALYNQVRNLQVHPLLQQWLANQLNPVITKQSPPEIQDVSTSIEEDKPGLLVKGTVSDRDGDIDNIILRYHWEDEPPSEIVFDSLPFQYSHTVSSFIPMEENSMRRLFYELIVVDSNNHKVISDPKETFYLNNQIQSYTYPLHGAKLVLGDYTPEEYDKVYRWFKSYLAMAKDAKFIPLGGKSPYFIFLGQPHQFIQKYQGPLFLLYTPLPFTADSTKLHVHRYFLSYWYGPGWSNLSQDKLEILGDGLLLGKGSYVNTLKYLQYRNPEHFYSLLQKVGEGRAWDEAMQEIYQMSTNEIRLRSLWHVYGNNVLAVVIILFFAWLGKTGLLLKLKQARR